LIINAFSLVQLSILRKKLLYKNLFFVSTITVLISGASGIIAAYRGLGVWSLVIQNLTQSITQASLLWFLSKWRPVGRFSLTSLKTMFSFGSKLLIAGLIETVFRNLYQTFIGRVYSPSDVGFYSRAVTMESAASAATSMALGQVIFSAFAPYQDDKGVLRKVHDKTIRMSMFVLMPVMIGLIATAEPLFLFLLTEKWAESIPYFQLLCVIGLLFPIVVQNYNLLRITGHTGLHLKLEIFKYLITIIAIALTYKHGILALIYGQIAVAYISHLVVSHFAGRLVNYSLFDQFKSLFPISITAIIMGGIVFFAGKIGIESNFLKLIIQAAVGIIVYFIMNKMIKSKELEELLSIITNFLLSLYSKVKNLL
jgi:O-antigen/teichoic acid export membrane protein